MHILPNKLLHFPGHHGLDTLYFYVVFLVGFQAVEMFFIYDAMAAR